MGFLGITPRPAQKIIAQIAEDWTGDIYVGCSGAFTIERALARAHPGKFTLHGNDISLYSLCVGEYFSDGSVQVTHTPIGSGTSLIGGVNLSVSKRYINSLGFLNDYISTPLDRAATIIEAHKISYMLSARNGSLVNVPYYIQMRRHYENNWKAMHAVSRVKLEKQREDGFALASYTHGDVAEYIKRDEIRNFIAFPELYTVKVPDYGEDYANHFRQLHWLFDFTMPSYAPARAESLIEACETRGKHYTVLTSFELPERKESLAGLIESYSAKPRPLQIYSDTEQRFAEPRKVNVEKLPLDTWGLEDELKPDSVLSLVRLNLRQYNTLRMRYLRGVKILAPVNLAMAVCIDNKIVGAWGVSNPPAHKIYREPSNVLLVSILSVHPNRFESFLPFTRLTQAALQSTEAKLWIERVSTRRVRFIIEERSTKREPFRSILLSESTDPVTGTYRAVFRMNAGIHSLIDGYADWYKRHVRKYKPNTED